MLCSCVAPIVTPQPTVTQKPKPEVEIKLDVNKSTDTREIWKIIGKSESYHPSDLKYYCYSSKEEIHNAMKIVAATKSNAEGKNCFLINLEYENRSQYSSDFCEQKWDIIFYKREECDNLKKTKWREVTFYNDDIVSPKKTKVVQKNNKNNNATYKEDNTSPVQQERVAIINSVDNNDSIGFSDLYYLTGRLRETAVNVLPKQRYGIMTTESIVAFLGSEENARRICNESSCLAEIGRKVSADYVVQARVGRFNGNLAIGVELYSVKSGVMVGSFTGNSKDISGLLSTIDKKAPDLFKQMLH